MPLVLVNSDDVRRTWEEMARNPLLHLVCLRHAAKLPNAPLRCGLTPRGVRQAERYYSAISEAILPISGYLSLFASNTERTVATVTIAVIGATPGRINVGTPEDLDVTNCGPNEEDLVTARKLGEKLDISMNAAFDVRFEDHGFTRVGERPELSQPRVRQGLIDRIRERQSSNLVVIYGGNSPIMNKAVGVPGVLPELGTLFLTLEGDEFRLLGRVDPVFEDVAD